jgi:hypothetical protein
MQYSTQFIPEVDELKVRVVRGPTPVQMMLCLQNKNHAVPPQAWIQSFGNFLKADICVTIENGLVVNWERLRAMLDAARKSRKSNHQTIIPYKVNWVRSLGRALMSI